ncbi:TEL2-interacting protein 1 [Tritrichomonas musculus]|uniref:TEL2-interacting protein 1 n=1 Tax=Tritrichomonas musculus TaxID=1915356 RepID=A0ABR2J2R5_9EUKA
MPRIYELLDTRDSFSLPILRMFPRVAVKIPSNTENIIDRSIHFVLSPSISLQCAALDAIIAAIPLFKDQEKLLPMIHQMWAPMVLIMRSSADCSNAAARRAVVVCETALLADRSFVRNRIRDLLPLFSQLIEGNLTLLENNPDHRQAYEMINALLSIIQTSLEGPDVVFDCLELEVFSSLLLFFRANTKAEFSQKAVKCLRLLYDYSKTFVWVLMMEVAQKYPEFANSI